MDCTSPSMLVGAKWPKEILDDPLALDAALSLDAATATASADGQCQHLDHRQGMRNIYKFGGTSVGSPARLCGLVNIIREERTRILAVVVSAMGHTTDHLLEAVDFAVSGEQDRVVHVVDQIQELTIVNAHETQRLLQTQLGRGNGDIEDLTVQIVEFFKPLRELLFGISLLQEKTLAALDTVLSYGERISATIVAVCMHAIAFPLRSRFKYVVTNLVSNIAEIAHKCRRGCLFLGFTRMDDDR